LLLSRFWYFVLAVAAVSAAVATLLAQAAFDRRAKVDLEDQLIRDRLEIELLLRVDARTRLDALAPIAAHPRVRSALSKATGTEDGADEATRKALRDELRSLNRQLGEVTGDLVYATDARGRVVANLGAPATTASLDGFPLVERALAGYLRDDVWVINNGVYRMAARPVIDGGRYVGSLVHGQVVDDELAERLASRLGETATVVFFRGDRIVAAHLAAVVDGPRREALAAPLRQVVDGEAFAEGKRTPPMDLGNAEGVFSPVTGAAAAAGVGYGVARRKVVLAGPFAIFERVTSDDVGSLPWAVLAVVAVILFGVGVGFTWLERDRPLRLLARRVGALQGGAQDRLSIADYAGLVRRIADLVNQALDRTSAHAATKSGAQAVAARSSVQDLDEILGPTPGAPAQPFFGFKTGLTDPPPPSSGAGASGGGGAPAAVNGASAPGHAPEDPWNATAGVGAPAADAPAPAAPPPLPPQAPPPDPRPLAGPFDDHAGTGDEEDDEGQTRIAPAPAGAGVAPAAAPPGPAAVAPAATASAPTPAVGAPTPAVPSDPQEAHFRQVFDEFLAMKERCGEPTKSMTYEKFAQTLRKNQANIMQKHNARSVRFTVYEKSGKAALKATPIKD